MKKSAVGSWWLVVGSCCLAIGGLSVAVAEPSGDRPDVRHAWSVHDVNRPDPVKITADEGKVPSDAIVLFDGTAESVAKNWCDRKGEPTKWKMEGGKAQSDFGWTARMTEMSLMGNAAQLTPGKVRNWNSEKGVLA